MVFLKKPHLDLHFGFDEVGGWIQKDWWWAHDWRAGSLKDERISKSKPSTVTRGGPTVVGTLRRSRFLSMARNEDEIGMELEIARPVKQFPIQYC
jgi:hypothetical protein